MRGAGFRAARVAGLLAAVALAGCTSGGNSPAERLQPLVEDLIFGPEAVPEPPVITRAVLNQFPVATISLETENAPPAYVGAVADNGGYVVYQDAARRSVTLLGGLLTGTHGLGFNLSSIKTQRDDPVATQTPLADWPARVVRNYQFPLRAAADYEITVTCTPQLVARDRIEIVEVFYTLTRVQERCTNGFRTFENVYWVDATTGFIWQSRQWLGPEQQPFLIKIVRPYAQRA